MRGARPDRVDGQPVGQQQVVGGGHRRAGIRSSGRVHPGGVAEHRCAPWLVDRAPVADAVAEGTADDPGVLGEALRRLPQGPPAVVLQGLGEVPVVQGEHRGHVVGEELVDQLAVEVQACLARRAVAGRHDPWPGDREAIGTDAQRCEDRHVLAHAVAMVGRDASVVAPLHAAGCGAERVPDRRAATVLVHPAFDLERRRPHAPDEVVGEHRGGGAHPLPGAASPRPPSRAPRSRRQSAQWSARPRPVKGKTGAAMSTTGPATRASTKT